MAFRRATRFDGARTARVAAGWRRATVAAAGVLVAAALIGPSAANAHGYDWDPDLGATPSGDPVGPGSGHDAGGGPGAGEPAALPAVTRKPRSSLIARPARCWAPRTRTLAGAGQRHEDDDRADRFGGDHRGRGVTLGHSHDPRRRELRDSRDGCCGLRAGDTISLRDLLYMTLVNSEGDAATSVAMHVGGYPSLSGLDAREAFIERMNDRAAELGLDDTSFVNVSGADPEDLGPVARRPSRDDDQDVPGYEQCTDGDHFDIAACAHYSTARDLAALARVVLDDPLLATIVSTPSWTTTTWRRPNSFSSAISPMRWSESNTNQLLPGGLQAYSGAYGVKTGTSGRAGENLVSAATNTSKPAPRRAATPRRRPRWLSRSRSGRDPRRPGPRDPRRPGPARPSLTARTGATSSRWSSAQTTTIPPPRRTGSSTARSCSTSRWHARRSPLLVTAPPVTRTTGGAEPPNPTTVGPRQRRSCLPPAPYA